jgi:hypothetical protein
VCHAKVWLSQSLYYVSADKNGVTIKIYILITLKLTFPILALLLYSYSLVQLAFKTCSTTYSDIPVYLYKRAYSNT